jgi:hypothetical protein
MTLPKAERVLAGKGQIFAGRCVNNVVSGFGPRVRKSKDLISSYRPGGFFKDGKSCRLRQRLCPMARTEDEGLTLH